MSSETTVVSVSIDRVGLAELRNKWGWFVGLGALLIALGAVAIGASTLTTIATMVFLGWLMVLAGVAYFLHSVYCKEWGGFVIELLSGVLYAASGVMIIANPLISAEYLTLLIAMLLIFQGIFRAVVAVAVRFPNWIWLLLSGVVTFLLGLSIWHQWPLSGLWVIGLFVGVEMIFNGWSLVMLGLVAKNLPTAPAAK